MSQRPPSSVHQGSEEDRSVVAQSQPTAQSSEVRQRPVKLRSSCDECAAAKVRCSKEQPNCARCVSSSITCVYGLSRRFGGAKKRIHTDGLEQEKRRSLITPNMAPAPLLYAHNRQFWDDLLQCSGGETMLNLDWAPGSSTESSLQSTKWSHHRHRNAYDHDAHSTGAGIANGSGNGNVGFRLSRDSSMPTLPGDALIEDSLLFDLDKCLRHFPSSTNWDAPYLYRANDAMSIAEVQTASSLGGLSDMSESMPRGPGPTPAKSHIPDCYIIACSTIESLNFRPGKTNIGQSLGDVPTQTLDNVLIQNKTAINNVFRLLKCSCSQDPHLAMIYASIISKILIWYQVAAGCKKSTSWETAVALSTPQSSTCQPALCMSIGSAVAPIQIKLGSFNLDENDQDAFRIYLLLSELKKLSHLIDTFSGLGADQELAGAEGNLYATLGRWLKRELEKSIRAVKAVIVARDPIKES